VDKSVEVGNLFFDLSIRSSKVTTLQERRNALTMFIDALGDPELYEFLSEDVFFS
jgi:hypothetical protein